MAENASRNAWAQPGSYEVTEGVFRIPLPMPNDGLRAVNVYAIRDGDGFTLIDSGWGVAEARAQLDTVLTELGSDTAHIREFLITHAHKDHYNLGTHVRAEHGTPIALGAEERPTIEALQRADKSPMITQQHLLRGTGATEITAKFIEMVGDTAVDPAEWPSPDRWLAAGERVPVGAYDLEVVHTPGHTSGHIVFRDAANGLLFAGDHVLPHITPSIALEPRTPRLPLGDFLESLRRIRELPDTWLLPAHGPVTSSVHKRADELLEHHRARLEVTYDTVRAGARTSAESAAKLTWTRRERALSDLDVFNAMLAVLETRSHLDLLVARGELTGEEHEGVRYYTCS
ncbi:MBL fold metallo-hydrolase [Sciscionella marina]|uniref:MBL fold metallo-hydrolase n=1 Tax=Sciscionella marina TaxID=508770 RepID=UPI00035ECD3A|nr:MBL fold metallo-hydrolase [Sciscionella marina]